ncbi:hypothetical protein [Methanosarcina sp.]|uniref:hypothetical protein n=1 Tax=Methanosarcina sp. TaxID=2213 RepID=UPI003C762B2B
MLAPDGFIKALNKQTTEEKAAFLLKSEKWQSRAYPGNNSFLSETTLGGRKFPAQDSHDLTHKNYIYHKMVIGPCPQDNLTNREVRYSSSHSEEPGFG